jgi:CMP-N,N'-diacetyllegionaminic acid synthase
VFKNKTFLGIITARENSKRLKRKNLRQILRKPLIFFTINSAKNSNFLDRLIISSESKNILKVAKKFNCEIPFIRPKHLSKDNVGATEVVYHAITAIKKKYDYVVLLQPTSPLRDSNDIDEAIVEIINKKAVSLFSVYFSKTTQKFPIVITKNGFLKKIEKFTNKSNYYLNGAIYICKINYFLKKKTFYSNKSIPFYMSESRSVDIDNIKEFKQAETILKM